MCCSIDASSDNSKLLEHLLSKEVADISALMPQSQMPQSVEEMRETLENKDRVIEDHQKEIQELRRENEELKQILIAKNPGNASTPGIKQNEELKKTPGEKQTASAEIEDKIVKLSASDNVSELKILLRDPTADANSRDEYGARALHYACKNGQDRVVTLLLAHPGIVVNQKNSKGMTPFMMACLHGRSLCVSIMLKDSRVNVNEPDDEGFSPLRRASSHGHLEVLKWWIASNRSQAGNDFAGALQSATENDKSEAVVLLERFRSDATKTRNEVRNELGIAGQFPVLFSLLLYHSLPFENYQISR